MYIIRKSSGSFMQSQEVSQSLGSISLIKHVLFLCGFHHGWKKPSHVSDNNIIRYVRLGDFTKVDTKSTSSEAISL